MEKAGTVGTASDASIATIEAALGAGQELWPFVLYALAVVALLGITLLISRFAGSATPRTVATDQPFESGVVAVGQADDVRLTIEFYLIAMFFVIFDLEAIFIFAWAGAFYELGWRGYAGAAVFILVLLLALLYEWRTGVLDWGVLKRTQRPGLPQRGPV